MANVMFKKGLLANLPETHAEGTFYVTTDERAIYLDVSDSARIRLGDFQEFATVAALEANANPSTSALYYVTDINCLAKWNGTAYVQINRDTGFTSFEIVGEGNAVTAIAVDETDARKLVITKGATYMTAADVDGKISAVVGEIPADGEGAAQTVRQYIDAKTSGIASDEALSQLTERVGTAEGEIDALQEVSHTHTFNETELNKVAEGDVDKWNAAEQNAKDYADGLASNYDAAGAAAAVDEKLTAEVERAQAAEQANAAAAKAADDKAVAAQGEIDALEAKVGEVPADKTVVQMISDAQTAATYDDTEVRGLISDNATAIQTEKERMDAFMTLEDGQTLDAALDSLKEIQDFITNEAADADVLLGKVSALEAIVDGIGGEGESATVVAYVQAAIDALKIGDYAKAADVTAAVERIVALEGKAHTHDNKTVLDGVTAEKVSAWDAAQANAEATAAGALATAKTELEGKISDAQTAAEKVANDNNAAMNTRVEALEAIDHDAYVGADETNLQAAKDYADSLAGNYDAAGSAAAAQAAAEATAAAALAEATEWGSF